jgi:hypothetical protein
MVSDSIKFGRWPGISVAEDPAAPNRWMIDNLYSVVSQQTIIIRILK